MRSKSPDLPFDPFAPRAVGDPWRSAEPDIATVNAQPFEKIIQLLGQIDKTPNLSRIGPGRSWEREESFDQTTYDCSREQANFCLRTSDEESGYHVQ